MSKLAWDLGDDSEEYDMRKDTFRQTHSRASAPEFNIAIRQHSLVVPEALDTDMIFRIENKAHKIIGYWNATQGVSISI